MDHSFLNINNLVLLVCFFTYLALGVYIYTKDIYSKTNQSFAMILACLSAWSGSFIIWSFLTSEMAIRFWVGMTFAVPTLLVAFFLYFALVFPNGSHSLNINELFSIFCPALVMFIAAFTPLIMRQIPSPLIEPTHGSAYPIYVLYLLSYFVAAFVILFIKYLHSKGKERLQLIYVFIGSFAAAAIGIFMNIVLVSFDIFGFGPVMVNAIGPAAPLIFASFITYSIAKYRLLTVDQLIRRATLFGVFVFLIISTLVILYLNLHDFLFIFYVIAAHVFLGGYILIQNYKNSINRSFAAFTFFIALWILFKYLVDTAVEYKTALLLSKMVFIGAAFMPCTFLYFTFAFLNKIQYFNPMRRSLIFVPAIVFLLILPTNMMVQDVKLYQWGVAFIYGSLYPLFTIYFLSYFIYSFYNLAMEYRVTHGLKKAQIGYLFLGIMIAAIIGAITNILLPSLFGITEFYKMGPPSTIIIIVAIFYSIVKHRLMNIEFVIQKGLIYSVLVILIMATYGIAVIFSQQLLSGILGYGSTLIVIMAALIIAVTYQPVLNTMQEVTDRIFFRARYDYQRTIRDVSKALASVMRIGQLTRYIVEILSNTMKLSEISFLLFNSTRNRYRSVPIEYKKPTGKYKTIEIDAKSPIINYLKTKKMVLVADELGFEIEEKRLHTEMPEDVKALEDLRDELGRLGIAAWVPVISKGELVGIIAVGDKLSGDMYTDEDLRLLVTLSNQMAIALDNARLYEEILTTKNYTEDILNSITSGVVATDISGKIAIYNMAFEKMLGAEGRQLKSKDIQEVFSENIDLRELIKGTTSGKEIKNIESLLITKSQEGGTPVNFSSVILKDGAGKNMGFLFVITDLSERKELEGRVRQADKVAALGTMAAGMAHEIKNPLSSIKVFSQLILQRYDDEEYRKKFYEIIPNEIARIDRIVESLLGFARASQPKLKKCNIVNIINDTLKELDELISRSNINVSKKFDEVPEITADNDQIMQVFSNLILNSINAMPDGGELRVYVTKGKKEQREEPYVTVSIIDTGYGIPKENLKKLFDPFFTTKHGGTGLGLTIAHSIIEGHKGTVDVESEVGKGTSFVVTLPVSL